MPAGRDDDDDDLVWRHVAATVTPLPGRHARLPAKPAPSRTIRAALLKPAPVQTSRPAPRAAELDRRTEGRLRGGLLPIEGRLDLHGMTQSAAHRALTAFIRRSHAGGLRCLLVITGKGVNGGETDGYWYEEKKGILRQRLPEWLAAPDLAPLILRLEPAQPRHGGAGAFYVLLRRRRD